MELIEYRVRRLTPAERKRRQVKQPDPERSYLAKRAWRTKRKRIMRGIKQFHKSPRGKAFHRALTLLNLRRREENA